MEHYEKAYRREQAINLFVYPNLLHRTSASRNQLFNIRFVNASFTYIAFVLSLPYKYCFHSIKSDPTCLSCILEGCFRYWSCQPSVATIVLAIYTYYSVTSSNTISIHCVMMLYHKLLDMLTRLWISDLLT